MYYGAEGATPREKVNSLRRELAEKEESPFTTSENGGIIQKDTEESRFHELINGTITPDGISVESGVHLFKQAEARGVSSEAIIDSLQNPLAIKPVKYDELGRPSKQYIGEMATTAVNPETGKATICMKTHSKIVKKLKGERI